MGHQGVNGYRIWLQIHWDQTFYLHTLTWLIESADSAQGLHVGAGRLELVRNNELNTNKGGPLIYASKPSLVRDELHIVPALLCMLLQLT